MTQPMPLLFKGSQLNFKQEANPHKHKNIFNIKELYMTLETAKAPSMWMMQLRRFDSVCRNAPFIRHDGPRSYPNVGYNRPFVEMHRTKGFTLIELVVTLTVAAVLVLLVVPNMRNFILNSRLTTQANDLISDISVARSEAIKRGTNIVICTSSNGTSCTGSGWSSGRLIFEDRPPYNQAPDAPQEQIIRYHEALDASITADAATTFPDPVIFNLRGVPIDALGASIGVRQFELCDVDRRVQGRYLRLSLSGQLSRDGGTAPSCP